MTVVNVVFGVSVFGVDLVWVAAVEQKRAPAVFCWEAEDEQVVHVA